MDKPTYFESGTEEAAQLQLWIDGEDSDAPLRNEVAVVKYQLSRAVREGHSGLVRDLASTLLSIQKVQFSQRLAMGHLFSLSQVQGLIEELCEDIVTILRGAMPSDTDPKPWQPCCTSWETAVNQIGELMEAGVSKARAQARKRTPRLPAD